MTRHALVASDTRRAPSQCIDCEADWPAVLAIDVHRRTTLRMRSRKRVNMLLDLSRAWHEGNKRECLCPLPAIVPRLIHRGHRPAPTLCWAAIGGPPPIPAPDAPGWPRRCDRERERVLGRPRQALASVVAQVRVVCAGTGAGAGEDGRLRPVYGVRWCGAERRPDADR